MQKPDRQDACPTESSARDFMVGQASGLSIRNDARPRVPRGASPPNHFLLRSLLLRNAIEDVSHLWFPGILM